MARGAEHEVGTSLALKRPHSIVDSSGCQHQPIHLDDVFVAESQLSVVQIQVHLHVLPSCGRPRFS